MTGRLPCFFEFSAARHRPDDADLRCRAKCSKVPEDAIVACERTIEEWEAFLSPPVDLNVCRVDIHSIDRERFQ
jgi:hypothetical protein